MSILLCDVDGVLANTVEFMLEKLKSIFPNELWLNFEDITNYYLDNNFKTKFQQQAFKALFSKSSFWENIPVKEGAIEAINVLRNKHTILFVSKPDLKCKDWCYIRTNWLKEYFNAKYDEIILTTEKKYVMGSCMIDDSPLNLSNWFNFQSKINKFATPVVFDAPYNSDYWFKNRIYSWKEIDKIETLCDNIEKERKVLS
jgi:5'(3')-deoxyribonucleotidase